MTNLTPVTQSNGYNSHNGYNNYARQSPQIDLDVSIQSAVLKRLGLYEEPKLSPTELVLTGFANDMNQATMDKWLDSIAKNTAARKTHIEGCENCQLKSPNCPTIKSLEKHLAAIESRMEAQTSKASKA